MVKMEAVEMQPVSMELVSETVGDDRYDQGVEDGRQAAYDRFWNAVQNNGERTDYYFGFVGVSWNRDTFLPKYDIRPLNAYGLFRNAGIEGSLPELLKQAGVVFDLGDATNTYQAFAYSLFTELGIIDITKSTNTGYLFSSMPNIKRIEKLIVSANQSFTHPLSMTTTLEEITIEGTIGANGFDVSTCPLLTHHSLMSIVNALQSKAVAKTCTFGATNLAKLSNAEKAIATQKGWTLA